MNRPAFLLLGLLLATSATAADKMPMREVQASAFDEQRSAIVEGFADGGRYSEIDAEQKVEVMAALDRMQQLLGPNTSVEQLKPDAKVALYNDQGIVNNILTAAQSASREVCKRNRSVNSRLKASECHTVAEWERRRNRDRELADRARGSVTAPSGK